jgi:hypothetical protein
MLLALCVGGLFSGHLLPLPILYWMGMMFGALVLAIVAAKAAKIDLPVPQGAPVLIAMFALAPNAYASIKPLLNLVPFTADHALADLDHALFGLDPWVLLQWMRPLFGYYFGGWVGGICLACLHLAMSPASGHKDRAILTYFIMWSIVGPLVHTALPAGGPIFYQLIGDGDRFAALPLTGQVLEARNYLWARHLNGFGGQYAGISAMPSLHVAFALWSALAFWRSPLFAVGAAHVLLIFLLSVATGWHYAIDGIVGAALVIAIYTLLPLFPARRDVRAAPAVS